MVVDAIKKLAGAVRGSDRPTTLPGLLRPIDTDRLAQSLNISSVAIENGRDEIPPTTAQGLDAIEQKIVRSVTDEWILQGADFINNLRAYKQRLIGYSIASEHAKLKLEAENALNKLRGASSRSIADLGPLQTAHREAQKEYEAFRKRHRVDRPARLPSRRWTTFGLLTILVAFETCLNGVFFAKGSTFGLIGGVGTAIGVSLANVVVAFLLGFLPARWINHRNLAVKFVGLTFTAAGLAAIVVLHGFAAHFRESMSTVGEEKAFGEAIAALATNPFHITDLNSIYLFALGILFALSAFYKGYTFDDPYPGYGPVSRRAGEARENYSDVHSELFDDLDDIKDKTIRLLQDGMDRLPLFPQSAADIRAERSALVQTFRSYEGAIESAANQLLVLYRDANRKARTTAPPAHFDRLWSLPNSLLSSAEVEILTHDNDVSSTNDSTAAIAELTLLSSSLLAEHQKLHGRFPHPTEIVTTEHD